MGVVAIMRLHPASPCPQRPGRAVSVRHSSRTLSGEERAQLGARANPEFFSFSSRQLARDQQVVNLPSPTLTLLLRQRTEHFVDVVFAADQGVAGNLIREMLIAAHGLAPPIS